MKLLLSALLLCVAFATAAQTKEPTVADSVVIQLTEWQAKQMADFEQERKAIEDKARLLWLAILDANKIDEKRVANAEARAGGKIVFKLKKK